MMRVSGVPGPGIVAGRLAAIVLCLLALDVMFPVGACASCPVQGSPVVALGFHESYLASDRSVTHLGVDLSSDGGSPVFAPCDGVVSFVGNVPASEPGDGSTMRAVSLSREDGRTLTMMPFEAVSVAEGQQVHDGMVVGTLAEGGDRSVPASHLHVGLKEGSRYFDPLPLLGMTEEVSSRCSEQDRQQAMVGVQVEGDPLTVQDAWQMIPDEEPEGVDVVRTDDVPAGNLALLQDTLDEPSPDAVLSTGSRYGVAASPSSGQSPVTSAGARLDVVPPETASWWEKAWAAIANSVGSVVGNMVELLVCELGLSSHALVTGAIIVALVLGVSVPMAFWCRGHCERGPVRYRCRSAHVNGISTTGRGEEKAKEFALSAGQW